MSHISEGEMIELILTGKMAKTCVTDMLLAEYERRLEENKDKSGRGHAEYLLFQQRKKELGLK